MGFEIKDGKGNGYTAGVSSDNRLLTSTVDQSIFQIGAKNGNAYFIGTPLVTLTTAGENAIFYVKNNEDNPVVFENFFSTATTASGATGGNPPMYRINFYKNPTSMTVATASSALNQNFGSSNNLSADVQYGASGSAFSGGTLVAQIALPVGQFNQIPATLVLPKGSSFGISVTPPTGNTSMPVQFSGRTILDK